MNRPPVSLSMYYRRTQYILSITSTYTRIHTAHIACIYSVYVIIIILYSDRIKWCSERTASQYSIYIYTYTWYILRVLYGLSHSHFSLIRIALVC